MSLSIEFPPLVENPSTSTPKVPDSSPQRLSDSACQALQEARDGAIAKRTVVRESALSQEEIETSIEEDYPEFDPEYIELLCSTVQAAFESPEEKRWAGSAILFVAKQKDFYAHAKQDFIFWIKKQSPEKVKNAMEKEEVSKVDQDAFIQQWVRESEYLYELFNLFEEEEAALVDNPWKDESKEVQALVAQHQEQLDQFLQPEGKEAPLQTAREQHLFRQSLQRNPEFTTQGFLIESTREIVCEPVANAVRWVVSKGLLFDSFETMPAVLLEAIKETLTILYQIEISWIQDHFLATVFEDPKVPQRLQEGLINFLSREMDEKEDLKENLVTWAYCSTFIKDLLDIYQSFREEVTEMIDAYWQGDLREKRNPQYSLLASQLATRLLPSLNRELNQEDFVIQVQKHAHHFLSFFNKAYENIGERPDGNTYFRSVGEYLMNDDEVRLNVQEFAPESLLFEQRIRQVLTFYWRTFRQSS